MNDLSQSWKEKKLEKNRCGFLIFSMALSIFNECKEKRLIYRQKRDEWTPPSLTMGRPEGMRAFPPPPGIFNGRDECKTASDPPV
jgi:hypothetical protein